MTNIDTHLLECHVFVGTPSPSHPTGAVCRRSNNNDRPDSADAEAIAHALTPARPGAATGGTVEDEGGAGTGGTPPPR